MKLIINNSSMQPIYEQIVSQIKAEIMKGALKEDTALPSVRALARELKVSALTVKKAYDELEAEGFVRRLCWRNDAKKWRVIWNRQFAREEAVA